MAIDYLPARNASTGTEGNCHGQQNDYNKNIKHLTVMTMKKKKKRKMKCTTHIYTGNMSSNFYLTDLISPKDVTSQWVYELKKLLIDPKTLHSINYTSHFPVLMEAFRPCCCRSTLRFNFNKLGTRQKAF
ncbi:hypothetical protein GQX74_003937 [Glossina fuscipes]|nr:hypothetical protein GQX74_003937 [Glossina fuscipes]